MPGITERAKALKALYHARKRILIEPVGFVLFCFLLLASNLVSA
jgi:hypothetical protein